MYKLFPIDTFMVSYYIYGRHTRDAFDRAFTPSSWLSKYNRLKDFGVADIALPYKTTGDNCLSNIFNDKLADTFRSG